MACSSAALLNETLRFAFRLPLAPWEERLAYGGGEGCNVLAFATAFLCAALTLLSSAIIGLVLLRRWRHRRWRPACTMVPDELAAALREGRV
eukprot:COSAG02_NODE_12844_length_1483_cov_24.817919_2_plen_91_part_01